MAATGDEAVKLSQLKEWSDTLGGGFSPATSTVKIGNSRSDTIIVTYMGVGGSYQQEILDKSMAVVQVPIMSNIYFVSRADVSGGMVIFSLNDMGQYNTIVCVTEPTCSITLRP